MEFSQNTIDCTLYLLMGNKNAIADLDSPTELKKLLASPVELTKLASELLMQGEIIDSHLKFDNKIYRIDAVEVSNHLMRHYGAISVMMGYNGDKIGAKITFETGATINPISESTKKELADLVQQQEEQLHKQIFYKISEPVALVDTNQLLSRALEQVENPPIDLQQAVNHIEATILDDFESDIIRAENLDNVLALVVEAFQGAERSEQEEEQYGAMYLFIKRVDEKIFDILHGHAEDNDDTELKQDIINIVPNYQELIDYRDRGETLNQEVSEIDNRINDINKTITHQNTPGKSDKGLTEAFKSAHNSSDEAPLPSSQSVTPEHATTYSNKNSIISNSR